MNKRQIEVKRFFWKVVDGIESCCDTTVMDQEENTIEKGINLGQANVTFDVNTGMINVYDKKFDEPLLTFIETSEDLLILKELFEAIEVTPEVPAQGQPHKFIPEDSTRGKCTDLTPSCCNRDDRQSECSFLGCTEIGTVLDDVEVAPNFIEKQLVCEKHAGQLVGNITVKSKTTPEVQAQGQSIKKIAKDLEFYLKNVKR